MTNSGRCISSWPCLAVVLMTSMLLLTPAAAAPESELPRRAFLGLAGQSASDNRGLTVTLVADGATAAQAGLRVGDRLVRLNGNPVDNMSGLISQASQLTAGSHVNFEVLRDGHRLTLAGVAAGRPREKDDRFDVLYEQADIPDGVSRTIIYKPHGLGPFPAVYFLQGYTCGSIDYGVAPHATTRQLLEAFALAGFVVFRIEKPGVGDSHSSVNCVDIDYPAEQRAFEAGYRALLQYPYVDTDKVFLFGHSLGGVTAPLLAGAFKPTGVITYGAVVKPWYEYMIDVLREQPQRLGADFRTIQRNTRRGIPVLHDLMISKRDWNEITTTHADAIAAGVLGISGRQMLGRDYRFWSTLNDPDIVGAWAGYDGPVLAIYGSYDIEAISPEAAIQTAAIVNAYHPGNGESLILEGAEHGLARYPGPFEDYARLRSNGGWTAQRVGELFDRRIADRSIDWMHGVLGGRDQ